MESEENKAAEFISNLDLTPLPPTFSFQELTEEMAKTFMTAEGFRMAKGMRVPVPGQEPTGLFQLGLMYGFHFGLVDFFTLLVGRRPTSAEMNQWQKDYSKKLLQRMMENLDGKKNPGTP